MLFRISLRNFIIGAGLFVVFPSGDASAVGILTQHQSCHQFLAVAAIRSGLFYGQSADVSAIVKSCVPGELPPVGVTLGMINIHDKNPFAEVILFDFNKSGLNFRYGLGAYEDENQKKKLTVSFDAGFLNFFTFVRFLDKATHPVTLGLALMFPVVWLD
jgi:hypothetical protein